MILETTSASAMRSRSRMANRSFFYLDQLDQFFVVHQIDIVHVAHHGGNADLAA